MLETKQQARSPVVSDPATHVECLEFIRAAIAENDREFATQIAAVLKDVCQNGHADRAKIWDDLSDTERQQFQELVCSSTIARNFAHRIREAIGYQSRAVAAAVQSDLDDAIDSGKLTSADVVAVVGKAELSRFKRIAERCPVF